MLISETKKLPKNLKLYNLRYPTSMDDIALIIKTAIKHHKNEKYSQNYLLQSTSITIEDWIGPITFSAICSSSKHANKNIILIISNHQKRLIAGGDYNAKHDDLK